MPGCDAFSNLLAILAFALEPTISAKGAILELQRGMVEKCWVMQVNRCIQFVAKDKGDTRVFPSLLDCMTVCFQALVELDDAPTGG